VWEGEGGRDNCRRESKGARGRYEESWPNGIVDPCLCVIALNIACSILYHLMNFSIPSFCAAGTGKLSLMIGLLLQKLQWIVAQVSVNVAYHSTCPLAHFLLQPSAY
jgi:hypothetical protein